MKKIHWQVTLAILAGVSIVMALAACGKIVENEKLGDDPFVFEQVETVTPLEDGNSSQEPVTENVTAAESETTQGAEKTDNEDFFSDQEEPEVSEETEKAFEYDEELAKRVIEIATEQLGVPFKMGGDSPDEGFDSSGFAYFCLNEAGIKFPRSIKDQLDSGAWVLYSELLPGDIVYFAAEVGEKATFCGVYVGGGLMIYSPVPDDFVKTANITTNYWTTHFVTGLRACLQTNE